MKPLRGGVVICKTVQIQMCQPERKEIKIKHKSRKYFPYQLKKATCIRTM